MIPKPIDQIKGSDIESLITSEVREDRTIEYKSTFYGGSDADRKEWLADATAFANTVGGDIVFGVIEKDGLPISICGVPSAGIESETQRMEQLLRDALDPRVARFETAVVDVGHVKVLIFRIPRSFAGPHRVKLGGSSRFWARSTTGKYEMDTDQLRASFLGAESAFERARAFRDQRIKIIQSADKPFSLGRTRSILHIVPIDRSTRIDFESHYDELRTIAPPGRISEGARFNLDGFAVFNSERGPKAYVQYFRDGSVEAAMSDFVGSASEQPPNAINPEIFESDWLRFLKPIRLLLPKLQVPQPWVVFLSLLSVRNACFAIDAHYRPERIEAIDRDDLLLPETIVNSADVNEGAILLPAFHAFWQAAGFPKAFTYDNTGKRCGLRIR